MRCSECPPGNPDLVMSHAHSCQSDLSSCLSAWGIVTKEAISTWTEQVDGMCSQARVERLKQAIAQGDPPCQLTILHSVANQVLDDMEDKEVVPNRSVSLCCCQSIHHNPPAALINLVSSTISQASHSLDMPKTLHLLCDDQACSLMLQHDLS